MKYGKHTLAGITLSACMLFSSTAGLLSENTGITASAAQLDWGSYLKKDAAWYGSSEGTAFGDEILQYQLADGGWRKDMNNTGLTGSWAKSTIDNDATWSQIRVLSRIYNATGTEKYKTGALCGIDLLLNGQYDNGGWPQVFGDPGTYHAHITFNDEAMVSVMKVLQEVGNKSNEFAYLDDTRAERARKSVEKGVECILNCQIKVNGKLTAWGQQHDEFTLAPAGARAYELPSICTSESVGIVNFLRTLPNKDERIIRSINAAVTWFDDVKLEGIKFVTQGDDKVVIQDPSAPPLWTRFYDLESSRPMFSDRDGKVYYDVSQISKERRTGYAWYGTWPAKNVQMGTISETGEEKPAGTDLYVGFTDQKQNYPTVQQAVDAAAKLNPQSEADRVRIHIAPGLYREQVLVNTPYISFINDDPTKEVKLTWYYGIGYKYFSCGEDGYYHADAAASKTAKFEPKRWGSAVGLKSGAKYFRAEYITFENSFSRYVTDEELADGVELAGTQSITFQRTKGTDVTQKNSTERACAIAVEGDFSEFYKCTFLGSQDTLYTGSKQGYFRECHITGNTDYIFGQGNMVFQSCELQFAGYSDKAVGGYITAAKSNGKYLFYDSSVTGTSGKQVGAGYFGRPWGEAADVAFVNTRLAYEGIITLAGWTSMSGHAPEAANFKEFGTTAGGKGVNTAGRVANTVKASADGLDVKTYLGDWKPYYLDFTLGESTNPPAPASIDGELIRDLTPNGTSYQWAIDTDIQVGDLIYTDREAMTYSALPEEVIGAEAINTPCSAKNSPGTQATFVAAKDCVIYVALDSRIETAPDWLRGYTKTDLKANNSQDVTYILYRNELSAGDTVTLGMNTTSSYSTNYTVFLKEIKPKATDRGDILTDGTVDIFDLGILKSYLAGNTELEGVPLANADMNGDGSVDAKDAAALTAYLHQIK